MKKVCILLSTYNGEKYLKEQLNSILAQTYTEWTLYIRDDGSIDATSAIIDSYVAKYKNIKRIPSEGNVGVVRSFEFLLKSVEADYYSFCDQDDFWLPFKLQKSMDKILEIEKKTPNVPVGVFCDAKVVDEKLKEIYPSFWKISRIKPSLLDTFERLAVHNVAAGCTMVINHAAKVCSLPFVKEVRMHDYWILLSILSKGGKLSYVDEALMLYRQHGGNVIGAHEENNGYVIKKFKALGAVLNDNKKQLRMLSKLGFNSLPQYFYYKIWYFFKYRSV